MKPGGEASRRWSWGAGLCVLFAIGVAACSLGSDAQTAATTPAQTPEPRAVTDGENTVLDTASDTVLDTATDSGPGEPNEADGVTFSGHIEPIITSSCASCHTGNGPGTQHVRFDTADNVSRAAFAMAVVTEDRFMPPWPAGDESVAFDHDWSLTDDEIAAILAWDEAGAPLDVDPATPMVPANGVVGLEDPDTVVEANGSYDGELGQPDEYRCFVYDPEVTEPSFVSEMEFVPEQTQVVHHAVGFVVGEEDREAIAELEGADGQGGWTCFGFSPGRSADLVFTWAPGTDPTAYPEGTGLEMAPGDFFVMQTHYHYDVEADADRSSVAINWAEGDDIVPVDSQTYIAPAEIPCRDDEAGPLCDRDAAKARAIEAYGGEGVLADLLVAVCGDPLADDENLATALSEGIASASCDQPVNNPGEIVSLFGHQHELGSAFRMTLNPGRPDERILLDIPKWDFDWQLIYEPIERIVIERGDVVRVECTWDRSLRDPELEPAYVLWADGTDDEMCFSTIVTRPV